MPYHEIHEKKKVKNYALLVVMFALVATFFAVTIVKFSSMMGG